MEAFYNRHRRSIKAAILTILFIILVINLLNLDLQSFLRRIILIVAMVFFTCCCLRCVLMRGLPTDAARLPPAERDEILKELAGLWNIVPIDVGGCSCCTKVSFSQAYVTGDKITLSGGPNARTQQQTIKLRRTPEGRLYVDKHGSYISQWNKVTQEVHINNALNMQLMWKRPQGAVIQQTVVQAAPAVVVLPSWWETVTDPSGRVYYKNNYKQTTSWTPPTAQQIADETREMNAMNAGEVEGAPPPSYNAPPAYNSTANAPPPNYS